MQETWETWVRALSWEDPLEEGMATHYSILAWRSSRTEEPGGLWSIELQRLSTHACPLSASLFRWDHRHFFLILYFFKVCLKFCLLIYLYFYFLARPHNIWGLISLTRDWTSAPLHWQHGVLTTGLPGKFLSLYFKVRKTKSHRYYFVFQGI